MNFRGLLHFLQVQSGIEEATSHDEDECKTCDKSDMLIANEHSDGATDEAEGGNDVING